MKLSYTFLTINRHKFILSSLRWKMFHNGLTLFGVWWGQCNIKHKKFVSMILLFNVFTFYYGKEIKENGIIFQKKKEQA